MVSSFPRCQPLFAILKGFKSQVIWILLVESGFLDLFCEYLELYSHTQFS